MRKWFLLFGLAIIVSACGGGGATIDNSKYTVIYNQEAEQSAAVKKEVRDYTIAVIPKLEGIDYFNAVEDGVLEAAKDLNVNVIYKGPQAADAEAQIAVIRELLETPIDAIAVSANDPDKLIPVLQEAASRNIRVITWDADTAAEGREFFVNMVDPEVLGRHLMDTLAWSTEESGKYAIMTAALSASNQNEWMDWIYAQNEEYYPNMELVDVVANDDDYDKAYTSAIQLLEQYPDLAGIIGVSSVGPPSIAQAVKEMGKHGEVKVVGLSTPNLMRTYLHDGSAQVVTLWSPKRLGYLTVALTKNLLDGILPSDGQEIYNVGSIRVKGDMVIMGEPLDFTKENVDQYDF